MRPRRFGDLVENGAARFIPGERLERTVLVAVVDRVGRGGTRKVKSAFEDVVAGYASHDRRVQWPVTVEIASMAIMGATKSKDLAHTLFVSARAVESGMLDGLIAHEMGHMLRTESGHPSHDPEVFRALSREVRIPRAAEGAFGQAFNHIQDIFPFQQDNHLLKTNSPMFFQPFILCIIPFKSLHILNIR